MTKKKASLTVGTDLSNLFTDNKPKTLVKTKQSGISVSEALDIVLRQMKVTGYRERTMTDYALHVRHFTQVTGVEYLPNITVEKIYTWLSSMNVSNQTKLTRLKCLKAFLGRCFNNGWFDSHFWRSVVIKVDSPIKVGVKERDVYGLLSLLDLTDFIELRDAAAILLMYQTGIRINTLAQLKVKHVDLDTNTLSIEGGLLKNHEQIHLPFNDTLARILLSLIEQNKLVREDNQVDNDFLFISRYGVMTSNTPTNNTIQKRLRVYSKRYGFSNINPHAIRRGFAKDLLDRGYHIAFISKALGHADLSTTTRYLHLDKEEVVTELRKRF